MQDKERPTDLATLHAWRASKRIYNRVGQGRRMELINKPSHNRLGRVSVRFHSGERRSMEIGPRWQLEQLLLGRNMDAERLMSKQFLCN